MDWSFVVVDDWSLAQKFVEYRFRPPWRAAVVSLFHIVKELAKVFIQLILNVRQGVWFQGAFVMTQKYAIVVK